MRPPVGTPVPVTDISIIIPAGGQREVGLLQGWCGNFKQGERCEAYVDGERMWQYKVPAF